MFVSTTASLNNVVAFCYIYRAVYTVLGHISDAEELSDVITKTDDYLWLKVQKLLI